MKLTVLIDNNAHGELTGEWGLSLLLEQGNNTVLLDGGTTGAFLTNAEKLGVSPESVDCAVLSHAHYDHANGLDRFLSINKTAPLYLRRGTAENCYGKHGLFRKYIGIRRGFLKKHADRIRYADGMTGVTEICPDFYLVPHADPLPDVGKSAGMFCKVHGKFAPDGFEHEQSLVVRTEAGLVICNSCSHGGADRIITEVRDRFPGETVCAYVGGLHLFRSSEEEVRAFAARVRDAGIGKLITGHCTKEKAFSILKEELGDAAESFYSGYTVTF